MAIAYQKSIDDTTCYALWKIEETAEELYSRLKLSEKEKAFITTLNNGKRSLHWLSTRVLLRELLNTNEYIDCQVDANGKPYLLNFPHHISLSHSLDYAAVMISEDQPVGIDIEIVKTKISRIASKFLSKEELGFIDKGNLIQHLYVCWCAKEAIYKLQGQRNVSFKDHISLSPFTCKEEGVLFAQLNTNQQCRSFNVNYESFKEYMIGYVAGCKELDYEK